MPNATKENLVPFVRHVVAEGSEVTTDGWTSYGDLTVHGYIHTRFPTKAMLRLRTLSCLECIGSRRC